MNIIGYILSFILFLLLFGFIILIILVKLEVRDEKIIGNELDYDSFVEGETVNMTFNQFMTYYRLNPERYEIKSNELYCLNENEKYKIAFKFMDYVKYIKWLVKREQAKKEALIEQNKIELMEDLKMILEDKYSNENPERKEEVQNVRC